MNIKKIPIGVDDFKKIIESNYYYVDKTDIIEEILYKGFTVSLFPRPRRFGKSLFISMIDNFFNIEKKKENKELFKNLKISKSIYYKELSSSPVIRLNFKTLKAPNYEEFYHGFKENIREVFSHFRYLQDNIYPDELVIFDHILNKNALKEEYSGSIKFLSNLLYRYYGKKVIILIDEYDAPIQSAYLNNCYKEVMEFIKNVFSNALKSNDYCRFGILTGVMRVSGESLFSDLNNIKIYSVMEANYNEYFGFNELETKELLKYYDLEINEEVKKMYDGYNFNGVSIYNPWSILGYADEKILKRYWANTSSNELIMDMITKTDDNIKILFEKLIQGESIEFIYNEKLTFKDLDNHYDLDSIINFFLISGYLTISKENIKNENKIFSNKMKEVVIPNHEVKENFVEILTSLITNNKNIVSVDIGNFNEAIISNDKITMEKILNKVMQSMSFYDEKEMFYHGFMLGLFTFILNNDAFILKSNREAGSGRFDILIEKKDRSIGVILELKISKEKDIEKVAKIALKQMSDKEYYQELILDKVENILAYAIIFKDKKCIVR